MKKPRLAHLVQIPKPYTPAVSTDIAQTIRAARRRIDDQIHVRVMCPRNAADRAVIQRLETRK